VEIKNLVEMLEPKTLNQAYNLARLQDNTIAYRRSYHNSSKLVPTNTSRVAQSKPSQNQRPYKIPPPLTAINLK
jgi:hypothetical protein